MRISTNWLYTSGAAAISHKQAEMLRTQEQLSTGRRVLTPSDDPVAASSALAADQARALAAQFARNQGFAQDSLQIAESALAQVGDVLQDVRALAVHAGSGALSAADRVSLARDLRGRIDTLLSLANARDGSGGYLFSGFQKGVQPFARSAGGVSYLGDQGSRVIQVGVQRQLEVSASGALVFEGARAGNGSFVISPGATNTGSAIADAGVVVNPANLTGHDYRVVFGVSGGSTVYDVINVTTATTIVTGAAYVPGGAIGFDGLRFSVTGTPADNDVIDIAPSPRRSVFDTLDNLAALLESSASGAVGAAEFRTRLTGALASVDQAHDHLLSVRTGLGARLRELDSLSQLTADHELQHQRELSRLVDLDYAEAISRLSQQQISLDAAQKSYLRLTSLSLFSFL